MLHLNTYLISIKKAEDILYYYCIILAEDYDKPVCRPN